MSFATIDPETGVAYIHRVTNPASQSIGSANLDPVVLRRYALAALLVVLAVLGYFLAAGKFERLLVIPGAVAFVWLLTSPRWAVYQFVFCLFLSVIVLRSPVVGVAEFSAALLVLAGLLDFLLRDPEHAPFPRFAVNYILYIAALIVTALFAYDPTLAVNPIARAVLALLSLLALSRLLRHLDVGILLRLFYWLAVVHAVIALAPFVAAGGAIRAFGLASLGFDDLAMLALPIGVVLMLFAARGRSAPYAIGLILLVGGLIATQSRASIVLGGFGIAVAVGVSLWWAQKNRAVEGFHSRVGWRLFIGGLAFLGAVALAVQLRPDLFEGVVARFQQLDAPIAVGTLRSRLELWRTALIAFQSDPVTGIGPGSFRYADTWFPTLHLSSMYIWVKGLSAHNLVLHYLAETGIIGATVVLALFVNQFRIGAKCLKAEQNTPHFATTVALAVASFMFLVTALLEAGWMWAQFTFTFVFFLGLTGETARRLRL